MLSFGKVCVLLSWCSLWLCSDDFIGGRRPGGGSDGGHGSATPKRGRKRNASIAPGTATPMLKVKGKGKKAREKRRQQKKEQRRWQGGQ